MSHTPGPWVCSYEDDTSYLLVGRVGDYGGRFELIVRLHHEDDARLISAAPDLLSVVEELIDSMQHGSEYRDTPGMVDRMKAAVQKARGM